VIERDYLIVCLGNICRSPAVAEVLRQRAMRAGQALIVDSCGTGDWHVGQGADRRMQQAARDAGYDLSAHRARQLQPGDFARYRHVLAMDRANLQVLTERCPAAYRDRLGLFLATAGIGGVQEVPDPYYGDEEDFRYVLELAEQGADGLLRRVSCS
jgi:protein-tyrosine phosphatase